MWECQDKRNQIDGFAENDDTRSDEDMKERIKKDDRLGENKNIERRKESTERYGKKPDKVLGEHKRGAHEHTVRRNRKISTESKQWLRTFLTTKAKNNSVKRGDGHQQGCLT